jgi:hypothetical protein
MTTKEIGSAITIESTVVHGDQNDLTEDYPADIQGFWFCCREEMLSGRTIDCMVA